MALVQSRATSSEICGGWSGVGADFSSTPLMIIPPLLYTDLSPPVLVIR
jgi:hypothetical protein